MPRRELLTSIERLQLLAFPEDEGELIRLFTLTKADLAFVRQHRGDHNRLGIAVMMSYLRYPGRVLAEDERPHEPVLNLIAEQLEIPTAAWALYAERDETRREGLLDLGLRGCEVAAIQLGDINWREGTLTINHGKSRRSDVLPLAVPTGKAIVQYLRSARPPSTNRALFVRHYAPFGTPVTVTLVRGAIRRALKRCNLDRFTGPHVLRHTAAVRMRCAGASLKEVADVLRHRSLDTTMIYSKVDLPRLSAVAAPWPGGLS